MKRFILGFFIFASFFVLGSLQPVSARIECEVYSQTSINGNCWSYTSTIICDNGLVCGRGFGACYFPNGTSAQWSLPEICNDN